MQDLDKYSEQAIEFKVEFQGDELTFYCKPVSIEQFFDSLKGSKNPTANMRRTFSQLLLDEDEEAVSKEWIEKLLKKPALIPLGLKINAGINSALGLDDLAAKNG